MLEQIPVGVDRILQVVARDRAPDRVAVDVDDHRRRLAEEHRRRIGLHAFDVLRDDLALVDARQHAVERNHAIVLRDALGDLGDDLAATCGLASVGKFDSVIRSTAKSTSRSATDTLVSASTLIVPSAGLSPCLAVYRRCRVEGHVLLVLPARDLRLVDAERRAARRREPPGPLAINRRGRRCGRGDGLRRWRRRRLRCRRALLGRGRQNRRRCSAQEPPGDRSRLQSVTIAVRLRVVFSLGPMVLLLLWVAFRARMELVRAGATVHERNLELAIESEHQPFQRSPARIRPKCGVVARSENAVASLNPRNSVGPRKAGGCPSYSRPGAWRISGSRDLEIFGGDQFDGLRHNRTRT